MLPTEKMGDGARIIQPNDETCTVNKLYPTKHQTWLMLHFSQMLNWLKNHWLLSGHRFSRLQIQSSHANMTLETWITAVNSWFLQARNCKEESVWSGLNSMWEPGTRRKLYYEQSMLWEFNELRRAVSSSVTTPLVIMEMFLGLRLRAPGAWGGGIH